MSREKVFFGISLAITILTLIVEIVFIIIRNGAGAGLSLVFGLMASGIFRFLAELEGADKQ